MEEVVNGHKLFCENCNWIGSEKDTNVVYVQSPEYPVDEYLYPKKCCPVCYNENLQPLIKKQENHDNQERI